MRQSTRIVVNTAIVFLRMAMTFGIGLYVTRLLIAELGRTDYGILAALGASATLLAIARGALSTSAQRHLAHALGTNDRVHLEETFSTTLVVFAGLAAVLAGLGWLVGPAIVGVLDLPADREGAASMIFELTVANLVVIALFTPFTAVAEAHQSEGQVQAFDLIRSVLHLTIALSLPRFDDPLVAYAALILASTVFRQTTNAAVSLIRFPESRARPGRVRRSEIARLGRFAAWATVLNLSGQMNSRASTVLLAVFFQPAVAAAYAIATQLGEYHGNFCRVLPRVVQPAMTTRSAQGDHASVHLLALVSGRYAVLGVLFLVVPLLIETEGILRLWLSDVPPHTVLFVRLMLCWLTVHALSSGFDRAALAHGELAGYALLSSGIWVTALVLSALWFHFFDADPWALAATNLGAALALMPIRVGYVGRLIGLAPSRFWRESLWPVVAPAVPAIATALLVHSWMADGATRYLAVATTYALVACPLILLWSVGDREAETLARLVPDRLRVWMRRREDVA